MQVPPEIFHQTAESPATPYAWSGLQSAKRNIRQNIGEMPRLREKIERLLPVDRDRAKDLYEELNAHLKRLMDAVSICRLCLLEMAMEKEAAFAGQLHASIRAFSIMTPDYTRFMAVLSGFLRVLPGNDDEKGRSKTTSAAIIGRLMNNIRMGYYPTDLAHVDHIVRGITFPEGVTTNLLDPCCGCGLALRRLADGNNCWTYGVELDESRAEEAQDRLHRVGVGSFFRSRISHEAFHLLFLNPPYLQVIREGGGNARSEKMFLVDAMKYLSMGGLLVYILPYYRITSDIARVLCDNFTDLSVYRFMGKKFDRFRQVAVFGLRRPKTDGSELVDAFLETVACAEDIPELSTLRERRYPLPAVPLPVNVFKGAIFNELELQRQLKSSKSIEKLLERSALDSREKRPLLPLNVGQIGLIAGSGMINGLVECDAPHIVKGRIVKETVRSYQKGDADTILKETQTNKMIFNILTPGGFRSLV